METRNRPRPRCRGLALVTAVFLALVIFSLVTVTIARIRHDLRFTGTGCRKAQAAAVSRAALGMGLRCLASQQGFVSRHLVTSERQIADKAWTSREGETSMMVWFMASPAASEVYYMFARGTAGGVVHDALATIRIHRAQPGVSYVLAGDEGNATRIYSHEAGSDGWTLLEKPRRVYYDKEGNLVHGDETIHNPMCPTADGNGGLFAVWRENGLDTLVHFDRHMKDWLPVRPPPGRVYDPDGTLREDLVSRRSTHLDELASDGGSRLYARSAREGIDTLHRLDLVTRNSEPTGWPHGAWTVLPPAPEVRHELGSDGQFVTRELRNRFATNLQDLTSDKSGNLFATCRRKGVDTVYRWDAGAEKWDALPPPPRILLDRDASGAVVPVVVRPGEDLDMTSLTADPDGNVYARVRTGSTAALVKWSGARARTGMKEYTGSWSVLSPPDSRFFEQVRARLDLPAGAIASCDRLADEDPEEPLGASVPVGYDPDDGVTYPRRTRRISADSVGRLTLTFWKGGRAVPYQYGEGKWSLLPTVMGAPEVSILPWPAPILKVPEYNLRQVTSGGLEGPEDASYEIRSISN